MKALSIRQPWAWCILYAGKDIENRDWSDSYSALREANRLVEDAIQKHAYPVDTHRHLC